MPGARLTRADRERIAAGLTEGLGYAEIARRLSRPTSTVSREVGRNGGRDGYAAARAHDTTRRRARRRRPKASGHRDSVSAVRERLAEGLVVMGMPRMPCRVLACLFTTDSGSLTSAELVGRLRISPASVSKAIGYLAGLGLVRREREPGRRRERYVVDDDIWLRSWQASARVNVMMANLARQSAQALGPTTPAGARLAMTGRCFDLLHAAERTWYAALRREHAVSHAAANRYPSTPPYSANQASSHGAPNRP